MNQLRQTAFNTVAFGYHSFSEAGNVITEHNSFTVFCPSLCARIVVRCVR